MKATTKKEIVKDDFAPNYVTDFVNNLGLKMFETNRLLNRFMLAMIKLNESNNEKYKMENAYHETVLIEKQRYCQQIKIQLDRLIEISAPDIIINNHLERLVESNKVLKSINDKSSVEFYNDFISDLEKSRDREIMNLSLSFAHSETGSSEDYVFIIDHEKCEELEKN